VSDERADKTAAHKGNKQRRYKSPGSSGIWRVNYVILGDVLTGVLTCGIGICFADLFIKITEMAEGVGFEPTVGFPTLDFESSALNRTQPPFLSEQQNVER
jgi:hypothetical protein